MYDLERAFELVIKCEGADIRVKSAIRKKVLTKKPSDALLKDALAAKVITPEEYTDLTRVEAIRNEIIQVDAFTHEEYMSNR